MKIFDRLKTALASKKPPEVAGALDEARKLLASAEREREALEGKRREALLGGDDALAKHRVALSAAGDKVESAQAYIAELEARATELAEEGAERERRKRYADAKALAEAAAAALPGAYTAIVAQAHALLRQLAEAQAAVAGVNADLPHGATHLADPEMTARGITGTPAKVVSEEVVSLWRNPATQKPVTDPESAKRIQDGGNGRGMISGHSGEFPSTPLYGFIRRRYRKTTRVERVDGQWPLALSQEVKLPGLFVGSPAAWSRESFIYSHMAHDILAALDAARGACDPPPATKPAVIVDYEELPGAEQEVLPPLPEPEQQRPRGRQVINSECTQEQT